MDNIFDYVIKINRIQDKKCYIIGKCDNIDVYDKFDSVILGNYVANNEKYTLIFVYNYIKRQLRLINICLGKKEVELKDVCIFSGEHNSWYWPEVFKEEFGKIDKCSLRKAIQILKWKGVTSISAFPKDRDKIIPIEYNNKIYAVKFYRFDFEVVDFVVYDIKNLDKLFKKDYLGELYNIIVDYRGIQCNVSDDAKLSSLDYENIYDFTINLLEHHFMGYRTKVLGYYQCNNIVDSIISSKCALKVCQY